ncbi:hypothetical protein V7S43_009455 [Phytophthora oleae]|uniref:MBD domain-containing protein n=1 Tax=Phytophthora oleae TaxID=2107226 RepID=A0ABD3FKB0_9STRA
MAFRAGWREMKKDGWTSKKPTGLSVDFVYLKPGKNIKDVEGEDMFIGEGALMKYLDKIDLAALKAKKQARRGRSKASKPVAAEPCPVARPVDSPSIHPTIDSPHAEHPTVESAPVYAPVDIPTRPIQPAPAASPLERSPSPPKTPLQVISRTTQPFPRVAMVNIPTKAQKVLSYPDFEEADLSSNASDDSEENNQSAINEDRAGKDDESKEDSQSNYEPIQDVNHIASDGDPSKLRVLNRTLRTMMVTTKTS